MENIDIGVITSYSIHYTKLYDSDPTNGRGHWAELEIPLSVKGDRITSYNVCYTKLLRESLEIELGKMLSAKQNLEMLLNSLYEIRTDLLEKLFLEQQGEMDLFHLSILRANIVATDERIQHTVKAINEQEIKIDQKRKEIVLAKQDEEVLDVITSYSIHYTKLYDGKM